MVITVTLYFHSGIPTGLLHPLFTLTQQSRVNDMVKTMLDHYSQCGILPVWELEGNETFCMVGNHSVSVIAEAILKGIGDFNKEQAFEAMKATSLYDRDGMGLYDKAWIYAC